MKKFVLTCALGAALSCLSTGWAARAVGQERELAADRAASTDDSYYAPAQRTQQLSAPQLKAMARAEQRMARLAAMRAYGMSASRPTASAMAFTTMYAPAWQMPGGRPFAWWHPTSRGVVIYHTAR